MTLGAKQQSWWCYKNILEGQDSNKADSPLRSHSESQNRVPASFVFWRNVFYPMGHCLHIQMQNVPYVFQVSKISILPVCDCVVCDLLLFSFSKTDCNLQNLVVPSRNGNTAPNAPRRNREKANDAHMCFFFVCFISLMANTNRIIPVVINSFTEWNTAVKEINERLSGKTVACSGPEYNLTHNSKCIYNNQPSIETSFLVPSYYTI